jgi:hypothetical protein
MRIRGPPIAPPEQGEANFPVPPVFPDRTLPCALVCPKNARDAPNTPEVFLRKPRSGAWESQGEVKGKLGESWGEFHRRIIRVDFSPPLDFLAFQRTFPLTNN